MGDAVEKRCRAAVEILKSDEAEFDDWVVSLGRQLLGDDATVAPGDVSRELARALVFSVYADGLTDGHQAARSLALIAAAVRGAPEQFYFERGVLDVLYLPWEPAHAELLLPPLRQVEQACKQPARRQDRPGPNDPCSCGSGKKYKKCCGSAAARPPR